MKVIGTILIALAVCLPARAIEFNVGLDPVQEIPTPNLGDATPTGSSTVIVDTTTGEVTVAGDFAGLTSAAAAAHLHGLAPSGSTAGVLFGMSTIDAAQSGTFSGSGTLDATQLSGLLSGETYLNLHTGQNAPGEIRGQVIDDDIVVYRLSLSAAEEIPAPNLDGASPSGSATVVVDTSSGAIEVSGDYQGLTSDAMAMHLHGFADVGQTSGVIFPIDVTGGTSGSLTGKATLAADELSGLLDGMTYLNLHTQTNAAGELRAQVVPEPTALVLALGMLALLPRLRR